MENEKKNWDKIDVKCFFTSLFIKEWLIHQQQHTFAHNTREHAHAARKKFQEAQAWEIHAEFARIVKEVAAMFALFVVEEEQHKHTSAKDALAHIKRNAKNVAADWSKLIANNNYFIHFLFNFIQQFNKLFLADI